MYYSTGTVLQISNALNEMFCYNFFFAVAMGAYLKFLISVFLAFEKVKLFFIIFLLDSTRNNGFQNS